MHSYLASIVLEIQKEIGELGNLLHWVADFALNVEQCCLERRDAVASERSVTTNINYGFDKQIIQNAEQLHYTSRHDFSRIYDATHKLISCLETKPLQPTTIHPITATPPTTA